MLHISIKAEEVFSIFGFPITNSLLASYIVLVLFFLLAYTFNKNVKNKKSKFVFFILFVVNGIYSMFQPIMKDKTKTFFPLLASFLLYILMCNWFGLIPGVGSITLKPAKAEEMHVVEEKAEAPKEEVNKDAHEEEAREAEAPVAAAAAEKPHEEPPTPLLRAATADLNMTIALGLISVVLIQYYGIMYVGLAGYIKKFLNFSSPIDFFTGILEIVSEFSKIISFAFRLFGNIFAGEVLIAVIAFLIPVLATFPFLLLEIFVGFIQALVFSMLTAVFLNMSTAKHH